jgi:hypothetical protein
MNENVTTNKWDELVALFRRMCFLRRQGKAAASDGILHQQLPRLISDWSETSERDPERKKALLSDMFQSETRRVEDAYTLHELTSFHWREELMPALARSLSQEIRQTIREQFAAQTAQQAALAPVMGMPQSVYRPRIAFDDIPAIIDLIVAEEQRETLLKNNLAA